MSEVNEFAAETKYFETAMQWLVKSLHTSRRKGMIQLNDAISYSLLNGGKRFRPRLIFAMAEALEINSIEVSKDSNFENPVLVWAMAIECIHTYSLIHDDLPSMDNDDFRRGQPTNHKVHGEDLALLAGDALLTKAFELLTQMKIEPGIAIELVRVLSERAGMCGMVGGQAIDLRNEDKMDLVMLEELHRLKTGALISASIEGVGLIARKSTNEIRELRDIGFEIGLCFQLKDDLLDGHQIQESNKNFVFQLGVEPTRSMLVAKNEKLKDLLQRNLKRPDKLLKLLEFNLERIS